MFPGPREREPAPFTEGAVKASHGGVMLLAMEKAGDLAMVVQEVDDLPAEGLLLESEPRVHLVCPVTPAAITRPCAYSRGVTRRPDRSRPATAARAFPRTPATLP